MFDGTPQKQIKNVPSFLVCFFVTDIKKKQGKVMISILLATTKKNGAKLHTLNFFLQC